MGEQTVPIISTDPIDISPCYVIGGKRLAAEDLAVLAMSAFVFRDGQLALVQDAIAIPITKPETKPEVGDPEPTAATPDYGIEELGLSALTHGRLSAAGIIKVNYLVRCSADDLLDIRYFGEKCLHDVRTKLAERGLKLLGDE